MHWCIYLFTFCPDICFQSFNFMFNTNDISILRQYLLFILILMLMWSFFIHDDTLSPQLNIWECLIWNIKVEVGDDFMCDKCFWKSTGTSAHLRSTWVDLITVPPTKFKLGHLIGRRRFFDAFTYSEINSAHGHVKSLDGRDKSHSNK